MNVVFMFCTTVYFAWAVDQNGVRADMSNFRVQEFYPCGDFPEQGFYFFLRPKNFNGGLQLVSINMSLPLPVGNDVAVKVLFEIDTQLPTKNSWVYLFQIEGDLCKMLDRYAGQFWYDIQRALGIMSHSCPVPRGSYHADNYLMDYQKLKLQTFPFGKMRITMNATHKTRLEIRSCFRTVVTHST